MRYRCDVPRAARACALLCALLPSLSAQSSWTHLSPAQTPELYQQRAVAIDAGVLVLGTDITRNETWLWDGAGWTQLASPPGVTSRSEFGMAFDPLRQRVVTFGGYGPSGFDETWEWDGTSWTERHPATRPPGRGGHAMAFDPRRGRVVLFGGGPLGSSGAPFDDMWEWDGTDWRELHPAVRPSARTARGAMTWDPTRQRLVLFGGMAPPASSLGPPTVFTDTWTWDGLTWHEESPAASPTWPGPIAYDAPRARLVLFTVDRSTGTGVPRTWEWDGSTWQQRALATEPARSGELVADPAGGGVLLLVPATTAGAPSETWRFATDAPASFARFGAPCVGASAPLLAAEPFERPWLGSPFRLDVVGLVQGQPAALLLGTSRQQWLGLALPVDLGVIGMTGCLLHVGIDVSLPLHAPAGTANVALPLPGAPALAGTPFFLQALGIAPGANPLGALTSDAAQAITGLR